MSNKKTVLEKNELENLTPKTEVEDILVQGLKTLKSLGVKKERTPVKGYLKRRMIHGRPYWYRVFRVKVDGEWTKKEIYLGARKPRE